MSTIPSERVRIPAVVPLSLFASVTQIGDSLEIVEDVEGFLVHGFEELRGRY
eukprot:COSAG02_NODE_7219_length_3112_cov_17.585463_4_plen_52_part_00